VGVIILGTELLIHFFSLSPSTHRKLGVAGPSVLQLTFFWQGIISTLVQLFFAWRVWVFAQSWFFTALVTLGALAGGGLSQNGIMSFR
jgi:hypothetical protein